MPDAGNRRCFKRPGHCIEMVTLARCIAAASATEEAHRPDYLFRIGQLRARFHEDHLRSLTLLTFLHNLHDVIPVVLVRELNLGYGGAGPRPKPCSSRPQSLCPLSGEAEGQRVRGVGGQLWRRHRTSGERLAWRWATAPIGRIKAAQEPLPDARRHQDRQLKLAFQRASENRTQGPSFSVRRVQDLDG